MFHFCLSIWVIPESLLAEVIYIIYLSTPTDGRHRTPPSIQFPPFWGGKVKHPVVQLTKLKDLYLGKGRLLVFFPCHPQAYMEDVVPSQEIISLPSGDIYKAGCTHHVMLNAAT